MGLRSLDPLEEGVSRLCHLVLDPLEGVVDRMLRLEKTQASYCLCFRLDKETLQDLGRQTVFHCR